MGSSCTCTAEEPVKGGSASEIAVVLCCEIFAGRECVVGLVIFMGGCSSV